MFFANTLLGFTTIVTVILCMTIFISNPKRQVNRSLSWFILTLFLWLATNLATNISPTAQQSLFFARSTLVGAALIPLAFLYFTQSYVGRSISTRQYIFWSLPPVIILLTTPTGLNISSVEAYGLNTITGPIYYLLIAEFLVYFYVGLRTLLRYYKSASVDSIHKQQLNYIFVGVVLTLIPGVIANAILPVTGFDSAVFYGPNAVIFLALFMTVAIAKHRLLDIRLIVARSLGYVLSIGSLGLLYGVFAYVVVGGVLFGNGNIGWQQQVFYAITAVVLAFTFQPIKRFFNKLTNKFFYRDAYDPQELLDQLNKVLVGSLGLHELLSHASSMVGETLKADFCFFDVRETKNTKAQQIGQQAYAFSDRFFLTIDKEVVQGRQKIIVTDELEEDRNNIRSLLQENKVAVIIKLSDKIGKNSEGLGYMLLGAKKSGNPYSSADIKTLEIIADEMVIAIQNALRFEEIQNFAKTLEEKVEVATRDLRKANEKLKELDQTKDDFISMASHQLRTPLTSVKGYVSMVLEGDVGKVSKKQQELLNQAFVSSQRMVYLIADLLNVSRLKTGKFVIEAKKTNLADVIEGEIAQLTETAKGRDLEVSYKKPKGFPELMLDETKIRQVIMNFADNAIYYTPSGGHINIILEDKGESIEFRVEDDGIGVPKSEQHHLFNKFYRAGNAKKARPDGTGLGLFMAKKVVVAQGGAIIFRSTEGKGSTFGFSFAKKPLLPQNYKGLVAKESVVTKPKQTKK